MNQVETRLKPHNIDAEEGVLGGILIDPGDFYRVRHFLKPEMFYSGKHQSFYKALLSLDSKQEPIDFLTVCNELSHIYNKPVTGETMAWITGLINATPTSIHMVNHGRIVEEMAIRRQYIDSASTVATSAYDLSIPLDDVMNDAESAVVGVRQIKRADNITHSDQRATEFIDHMQNPQTITGIKTPYRDLNRAIGGLESGLTYWFFGAEKMGKSSFMNRMSLEAARAGNVVLRFGMEMNTKIRTRRDISHMTKIPLNKLKYRNLSEDEMTRAMGAVGEYSKLPLVLDISRGATPAYMRSVINRVIREYGRIDLIEIDYWQLMEPDKKTSNPVANLESTARAVPKLAGDFNVPIIIAGQVLSKAIDNRADCRPRKGDLHGSSAPLKEADFLAFLYRDEYYNPDTTERPNQGELNIGVYRDGDGETIGLYWRGQCAMYENLSKDFVNL